MKKTKVGYAPIVEPIFDAKWAEKTRKETVNVLFSFEDVETVIPKEAITVEQDAMEAGSVFRDEDVDVVIMQAINSDSGILATAIGQKVKKPILLWSTPEPSLHNTAVLANSTCGAMIIASTLRRLGLKYHHLHGFPDDTTFRQEVKRAIDAAAVIARFLESKIGLVGYVPPGFHHSAVDELLLRKTFGVKIHHIDLSELMAEMKTCSAVEIKEEVSQMKQIGSPNADVEEQDMEKSASLSLAMRKLASRYGLHAQAVKCFPEFQDQLRMVPCAALGRSNDLGLVTSCEADLGGALTMLTQHLLVRQPIFFVDIISLDNNQTVVWHCGNGVSTLADPASPIRYGKSALHGYSVTTEMAFKKGPVTIARFSQKEDRFHLYAFEGEAVEADPTLRGASMNIQFPFPPSTLGKIIFDYGIENHFSVSYGHIADQLEQIAMWLGIECTIYKHSE